MAPDYVMGYKRIAVFIVSFLYQARVPPYYILLASFKQQTLEIMKTAFYYDCLLALKQIVSDQKGQHLIVCYCFHIIIDNVHSRIVRLNIQP